MIELRGVSRHFGSTHALHDVNLFVQEGEIFGIIGRSGAGKSTLLRCMNLLERPTMGQVLIENEDITALKPSGVNRVRHKMAMIFQHFNLLDSCNVFDNIAFPLRIQGYDEDVIKEKILSLLPLVELEEKIHAYPAELSGGQKQRVAIARALACSPKILLCDEATSALDPETTRAILDLLKKINALYGITIVLVTHEMDVVRRICHRVGVMNQGRLAEVKALSAVFEDDESLAHAMFYTNLSPQLPPCLIENLSNTPTRTPLVRLFFQGAEVNIPFISQTSRDLGLDINILLANIDRYGTVTCGVLVAELCNGHNLLDDFNKRCRESGLTVEVLGYVTDHLA